MSNWTYAGQYGPDQAIDLAGRPLPTLNASVFAHGTKNLVTLYTDRTKATTASNPTQTDTTGNLTFFADPGQYDVMLNGATVTVTVPADPAEQMKGDVTGPIDGPTTLADTSNVQSVVSAAVGGAALVKNNNLSDLPSPSTARTNLGLGSAATHPSTDFDAAGLSAAETTRAEAAEAALTPLSKFHNYVLRVGAATLTPDEVTAAFAGTTLTLPTAPPAGTINRIYGLSANGGTTIVPGGTDSLQYKGVNVASLVVYAYSFYALIYSGSGWYVIDESELGPNVISALSFGADPTGTTDSAPAIQSAINAAGNDGEVYLPAGRYRINSTLTIGNGTQVETTVAAGSSGSTLNVGSTAGFAASGTIAVYTAQLVASSVTYTSKNSTQFLGCTGLPALTVGRVVSQGTISTINGVTLRGAGLAGDNGGFAAYGPLPSTELFWGGSAGTGPMLKLAGPIMGVKLQDLYFLCAGVNRASQGINFTAVNGSRCDNIFVDGASGAGWLFTAVNGFFANGFLLDGQTGICQFHNIGMAVPSINGANGFRFTGDMLGTPNSGSAGCAYMNFYGTYVSIQDPGTGNTNYGFLIDYADDITFRDTVFIATATPAGTINSVMYDYSQDGGVLNYEPSAILFDGVSQFGAGHWVSNTPSGCAAFAPNVVRNFKADFLQGVGPSTALADPNQANLRWDVSGGERVVLQGSTTYFTTNVAKQVDPVNPTTLYVTCNTAAGLVLAICSSSGGTFTTIYLTLGSDSPGQMLTFQIPAGWWVKATSSALSDFSFTAVTRNSG